MTAELVVVPAVAAALGALAADVAAIKGEKTTEVLTRIGYT